MRSSGVGDRAPPIYVRYVARRAYPRACNACWVRIITYTDKMI